VKALKVRRYSDLVRMRDAWIFTLRYELGYRVKDILHALEQMPFPQVGLLRLREICRCRKIVPHLGRPRKRGLTGMLQYPQDSPRKE